MSTIRKCIPDTITCMNLLCGVLGVIATFYGFYLQAFILMLAASVFDFFDGFAARALDAYSDLGKELDSLSDMVSFGVLPSVMLFCLMTNANGGMTGMAPWWGKALCLVPVLIAIFSGLRLAKFNTDPRQSSSFIGLPTPACAMICGSLVCYVAHTPDGFLARLCSGYVFIPVVATCLALLLMSELPMFSMKFHKGDDLKSHEYVKRYIFAGLVVVSVIVVAACRLYWPMVLTLAFTAYLVMNLVCDAIKY